MKAIQKLRQMIHSNQLHVAPGAFDGLSTRLVEQAGFNLIYASGGAIARSSGYPDVGLLSMSEVLERVGQMIEVTQLPIIADADTGYGNALNVQRAVKLFERLGVAGIHMEDQLFPKRCGHLEDKSLISMAEMAYKVRVAKESLSDPDFVLIARTDAIAVEGINAAIERAQAYVEAGADVIFVEAPETLEQIEMIAKAIKAPKLINMFYGGKTPLVPITQLQEMGYRIAIIPSDLQRAAIKAMQTTLAAIYENGDSKNVAEQMVSFKDREKIVGTQEYLRLDKSFS